MGNWKVEMTIRKEASITLDVEAENEDDAGEIAWGMYEQGEIDESSDIDWWDYDCIIDDIYSEDEDD